MQCRGRDGRARGITHVLHRPEELGRLAAQYGWPLTPAQEQSLQAFFALLGKPLRSAGPAKLYSLTGSTGQPPSDPAVPSGPGAATAAE